MDELPADSGSAVGGDAAPSPEPAHTTDLPLVSIVVPSFNDGRFIADAIESVLAQRYPRLECIIVDGGSTDATLPFLDQVADARLRWVSEPDNGQPDAIAKGWRMATGDVLHWLNADDKLAGPDAVSTAVDALCAEQDVDVVYGDCGSITEGGDLRGMSYVRDWDLERAIVECDHCIAQPAAFTRRSAVERVGGLDVGCPKIDHDLWLRIGLTGRLKRIRPMLALERVRPGISHDGRTMAHASLQVTEKVLARDDLPPTLRRQRERIRANARLRAATYAYEGGRHFELMAKLLLDAARIDPSSWRRVLHAIAYFLSVEKAHPGADPRVRGSLRVVARAVRAFRRVTSSPQVASATRSIDDRHALALGWARSHLSDGSGEALVVGEPGEALADVVRSRGFQVTRLVQRRPPGDEQRGVRLLRGSVTRVPMAEGSLGTAIVSFGVEDAGLGADREAMQDEHADRVAMKRLRAALAAGGQLLLLLPCGQRPSPLQARPRSRVYDEKGLEELVADFVVEDTSFWTFEAGAWRPAARQDAMQAVPVAGAAAAVGALVLTAPR